MANFTLSPFFKVPMIFPSNEALYLTFKTLAVTIP